MKEEVKFSNATVVALETAGPKTLNLISNITVQNVYVGHIDQFNIIPPAITPSRLPFPVIVPANGRFKCLDGFEHLNDDSTPRCLCLTPQDTSDAALALLATSLRMSGLCGTLCYAEQARNGKILFGLHQNDPGLVVNEPGGDRRSEDFNSHNGERIQQFLAGELDRSESTIRGYLDHTRYLSLETMNELANKEAPKQFFVAASKLRSEFLDQPSCQSWSEEEKTSQISRLFLEWHQRYDAKKREISPPQNEPEKSESKLIKKRKNDQGNKSEPPENPKGPQLNLSSEIGGDGPAKKAGPDVTSKEETNEENSDKDELELEKDDLTDEGPPEAQGFAEAVSGNGDLTEETFNLLVQIGSKLITIGQTKPAGDLVRQELKEIVAQLMKLISADLQTTTLINAEVEGLA